MLFTLILLTLNALPASSQEKRTKVRISNAGLTITALPLLAARDWGTFKTNGLDVEIIVMSPPLGAAAMAQGDIDYVAGVGPASVAATLTGLPSRAIWFSSDRISYWIQAAPQFKTLQDLKGKKIALSGGVGGTNHVALSIALEKSGFNPKDYTMVAIPGQQIQILYSLESGFVDAALMSPPHIFAAAKKGFNKLHGCRRDGRDARRRVDRHGENNPGATRPKPSASSARCKSPKMRCANPNPRPSS